MIPAEGIGATRRPSPITFSVGSAAKDPQSLGTGVQGQSKRFVISPTS